MTGKCWHFCHHLIGNHPFMEPLCFADPGDALDELRSHLTDLLDSYPKEAGECLDEANRVDVNQLAEGGCFVTYLGRVAYEIEVSLDCPGDHEEDW